MFKSLLDLIYPIGTIYQSFDPTNPSDLFGGTWAKIEDTFLRAGASADISGGQDSFVIQIEHMPKHSHTIAKHTHTFSGTVSNHGGHSHGIGYQSVNRGTGSTITKQVGAPGDTEHRSAWDGSHNHTYSGTTAENSYPSYTGETGGGKKLSLQFPNMLLVIFGNAKHKFKVGDLDV